MDILKKEGTRGRPEGGNIAEKIRRERRKKIVTDPDFNMPRFKVKEFDNTEQKFRCCMCGSAYSTQRGNFLTNNKSPLWRGNNGYLPICKACCDTMMKTLTVFYSGNEEHALRHMCAMFDWYYNETASGMTCGQGLKEGQSRISFYPSKVCTSQVAKYGSTFLDTIKDEELEDTGLTHDEETVNGESGDEGFKVTPKMIRTWGRGLKSEHYQFLEEEYADWTAKNVCNTKSQEEIYRNIALAQLDIRIAREKGNKTSDAQEALQKLMNSANILPKQTSDNPFAETQTFGTMLKKFEETRPLPEPDPAWKDVDGIRRYIDTWFYGHLSKALGVKNENAAKYAEEVEKYTVDRPNDEQLQQESELLDLLDQNTPETPTGDKEEEGGGLA